MAHRFFLLAAALVVLSACDSRENCFSGPCGGSAAGGTGGTGGVLAISDQNGLDVLREAWFAAASSAAVPTFVVSTGVGDTSGGTALKDFGADSPVASLGSRNRVSMTPFGPTTYNCPVSGTFIVSGDVADPQTVTAGDYADYDSSACDSGTGYSVDGSHSLDVISVDGDPNSGAYEQVQLLSLNGFRATSQNLVTTLNGDLTSAIDSRTAGIITHSFSGDTLTIDEDQITIVITGVSGIEVIETVDPFTYTLDVAGTANSTLVSGTFDFAVTDTLQQRPGEYPFAGALAVVGAAGSTARISVVDETTINYEVDSDGSGGYEVSMAMSWDEFFSSAGSIGAARQLAN